MTDETTGGRADNSPNESRQTVYAVIKESYGAISVPDSIWGTRGDAVARAVELADGAEFTETPSDAYWSEGHAKDNLDAYRVHEYDLGKTEGHGGNYNE